MFYRIVAGGSKGFMRKRESDVTVAPMRRSRMDLLDDGTCLMCFCGMEPQRLRAHDGNGDVHSHDEQNEDRHGGQ